MAFLDDYRNLTPLQRSAWVNWHTVTILQNPPDVYVAMAGYPYGGLRDTCCRAKSGEWWMTLDPLWPDQHWFPNDYVPDGKFYLYVDWGMPMQAHSLWQEPDADYAAILDLHIKPKRSYDTGVCRRRRNHSDG